jgi:hypothetical protein
MERPKSHTEVIKRNREELRNNLKGKLKLPIVKKQSLQTSPIQTVPEPQLDRRLFDSVFEILERLGKMAVTQVREPTESSINVGRKKLAKYMLSR